MNLVSSANWPKLIGKYVYQLIALYVALGLIAVGYNYWQSSSSDSLRRLANDYHLASSNHFLKAIEEIRHIKYELLYQWVGSNIEGSRVLPGLPPASPFQEAVSLHLIQQAILDAQALHAEFGDSRFDALNKQLKYQLPIFTHELEAQSLSNRFSSALNAALEQTMTPLLQLERLHVIERDNILVRLRAMQNRQTQVFAVLVLMLFFAGFLSTRRVLRAIDSLMRQRVRSEQQVRIFSEAIEQSPLSILLTDTKARLVYANSHFEKVSGYKAKEVIGQNLEVLHEGISSDDAYKDIWDALSAGQPWNCDLESRNKDGKFLTERASFSPVFDEAGGIGHYLLIKEDITLHKQQEEQILYQAHYDSLTNLPNRFLALDRLSLNLNEAQRKREKVALLFLDLDDFKKVNDTLGHDTGDKLLIDAAQRLRDVVRSGDTVARLGGDEFIVLLPGLSGSADALPVADNLINQFREAFRIDGREMILTASLGIALYPDDGDTASELLRKADSAMYDAKSQGRNTYAFFTESMNQDVSRRLALEEQMHGALDRGEFYLLYQPKVEVSTGQIIGAEALLRWDNPVLDGVMPHEFIPIAEQTGFIVPIGEFVLEQALQMAAAWMNADDGSFTMAINLSPRQFRDPNLVRFIESTIEGSNIAAQCLELEITEGVLMSGHAYIDDALEALHKMGVELAMDDFGKGYSSLNYLRTYPFTTLKIDRDFIKDVVENPADQELVSATIAMAQGLGLKVVAEGVETDAQLQYLRAQHCDFAQGYLFGRPISTEHFSDMLKQQRTEQAQAGC